MDCWYQARIEAVNKNDCIYENCNIPFFLYTFIWYISKLYLYTSQFTDELFRLTCLYIQITFNASFKQWIRGTLKHVYTRHFSMIQFKAKLQKFSSLKIEEINEQTIFFGSDWETIQYVYVKIKWQRFSTVTFSDIQLFRTSNFFERRESTAKRYIEFLQFFTTFFCTKICGKRLLRLICMK